MKEGDRVRPFSNGSQWMDWQASNCERCIHADFDAEGNLRSECPLLLALSRASIGDGTVSADVAVKIGIPGNERHYVWPCTELEIVR